MSVTKTPSRFIIMNCRGASRAVRIFFEECHEHQRVMKIEHAFQIKRMNGIVDSRDRDGLTYCIRREFLDFVQNHERTSSFIYMTLTMEQYYYPDSPFYEGDKAVSIGGI